MAATTKWDAVSATAVRQNLPQCAENSTKFVATIDKWRISTRNRAKSSIVSQTRARGGLHQTHGNSTRYQRSDTPQHSSCRNISTVHENHSRPDIDKLDSAAGPAKTGNMVIGHGIQAQSHHNSKQQFKVSQRRNNSISIHAKTDRLKSTERRGKKA